MNIILRNVVAVIAGMIAGSIANMALVMVGTSLGSAARRGRSFKSGECKGFDPFV